jgi:hypothetical protein
MSAVLPDESGPAVALPGVCRLMRVEGYGGAQQKPLLLIGMLRDNDGTSFVTRLSCDAGTARNGATRAEAGMC